MMNLPTYNRNETLVMTSLDLAALCVGDKKNAHSHFLAKANKVLGAECSQKFGSVEKYGKNNTRTVLFLPEREACLMAMSYSYELQAKVYDAWQLLKKNMQSQTAIENPYTKEAQKAKALLDAGFTIEQIKKLTFNESKAVLGLPPLPETHKTIKMMNLTSWIEIDGKSVNIANRLMHISKAMKFEILKAPHDRHGTVNAYHKDAFKILFLDIE